MCFHTQADKDKPNRQTYLLLTIKQREAQGGFGTVALGWVPSAH